MFLIFFDTSFGIDVWWVLASISTPCWEPFNVIFNVFRDRFLNEFSMTFLMDFGPKPAPFSFPGIVIFRYFSVPDPKGVFSKVPWLILAPFWLHLAPFWLPFTPFRLPLFPFRLPLALFWLSLAPFWVPNLWKNFLEHFQRSTRIRKTPAASARELSPKRTLSFARDPLPPGPERNLAVGNLINRLALTCQLNWQISMWSRS